jgi:nucleoside-diphosphate-sugar epimerase
MNKTVLITGIHGFVGSNLIAGLKSQHTLYGLDIISPQVEGVIKTFEWDELNKIPSVDLIIHLAGKAHDTKKQTNSQEYFDINTGLTKKIFDWFITTNAKKFIFFSSVKAVADQVEAEFLTEDMIPNPKGPYGESKMLAEKYILKKKLPGDKKTYILRPCMIHGSGNRGNLNLLYKLVQKGFPWPLGLFNNSRSFTSIDNVSFVISEIIGRDIAPGIYQLADDDALSTNELIQLMAISQNKKTKIWLVPVRLIKALSLVGDFLHLPLNSERLKKLTETYVVSNQKLKIALGIDKMPISALEGMRKTLDSFKK